MSSALSNLFSCFLVIVVAFIVGFRSAAGTAAWLWFGGHLVLFTLARPMTKFQMSPNFETPTLDGQVVFSRALRFSETSHMGASGIRRISSSHVVSFIPVGTTDIDEFGGDEDGTGPPGPAHFTQGMVAEFTVEGRGFRARGLVWGPLASRGSPTQRVGLALWGVETRPRRR